MFEALFSFFSEVISQSLGSAIMVIAVLIGFALLCLWLIRFTYQQGRASATFVFGLVSGILLIALGVPSDALASVMTTAQDNVLKPYRVAQGMQTFSSAEYAEAVAMVTSGLLVQLLLLGFLSFALFRNPRFTAVVCFLGIAASGGMFGFGLLR